MNEWVKLLLWPVLSSVMSAAVVAFIYSFRIGRLIERAEQTMGRVMEKIEDSARHNGREHDTLDGKITRVEKSTQIAHERIDKHAVEIGMLKRDTEHVAVRLDKGFSDMGQALSSVRGLLDRLLLRGNGHNGHEVDQ